MERNRIPKRIYVGKCAGRPWKRWIGYREGLFKKKRFGCQSSKGNCAGWEWGFVMGSAWGVGQGMNPRP